MSFAAAEATWAMMLNANKAKDWDIVKAALVDVGERAQERHVSADWCADNYEEDEFESLSMKAAGERDAANDARLDRMADVESQSVDSSVSVTESELNREAQRKRMRYVDDEAEESDN